MKIQASVDSETLGALQLFHYVAQRALRLRKMIIFGVAHEQWACMEPESRVMLA